MRALGIVGLLPLVFGAFILFRLFRGRVRASVEERRAVPAWAGALAVADGVLLLIAGGRRQK